MLRIPIKNIKYVLSKDKGLRVLISIWLISFVLKKISDMDMLHDFGKVRVYLLNISLITMVCGIGLGLFFIIKGRLADD